MRSTDGGKEKSETNHFDLPPDLANGLLMTLLKNVAPDTAVTKLSYVAATPKPRLVGLTITPEPKEQFSIYGALRREATHYNIKVDIGGLTGAGSATDG